MFKIALGTGIAILLFGLFIYLPNINIETIGLNFSTMDTNTLWIFRLGLLFLTFVSMFGGVLSSVHR
jgi:hypothetical protein